MNKSHFHPHGCRCRDMGLPSKVARNRGYCTKNALSCSSLPRRGIPLGTSVRRIGRLGQYNISLLSHGLRNEMSKLSALKKFLWLGLFFVILKQGVTLLEVLAQEKCNMKSGSAPPSQATLLTWMVRTSMSS